MDEVFEIVDKLTARRTVELMFPTAMAAFAWLEPNIRPDRKGTGKPGDENTYRVQSVRMWQPAGSQETHPGTEPTYLGGIPEDRLDEWNGTERVRPDAEEGK